MPIVRMKQKLLLLFGGILGFCMYFMAFSVERNLRSVPSNVYKEFLVQLEDSSQGEDPVVAMEKLEMLHEVEAMFRENIVTAMGFLGFVKIVGFVVGLTSFMLLKLAFLERTAEVRWQRYFNRFKAYSRDVLTRGSSQPR